MIKLSSILLLFFMTSSSYAELTVNAMAPLIVEDRSEFQSQLRAAKKLGVSGISVDVWWGKVEASADQKFDWQYYEAIFADIIDADLNVIPIMSFHQCGGNVGDNCNIPIPAWIWEHYSAQGLSSLDLQYKSEYGNYSKEVVSLWADEFVLEQYAEFIHAFSTHFHHLAPNIAEVNISMGAAGELRFPSYNSHDGDLAKFPTRGSFQAYSLLAISSFRDFLEQRYGGIEEINQVWRIQFDSLKDIHPPINVERFISAGEHINTLSGRDFIDWYNSSLIKHGERMLKMADTTLKGGFSAVPIGFKIPGIHWKIAGDSNDVRSAELAAGLIDSQRPYTSFNGHGYQGIVAVANALSHSNRPVILHFTALEMRDNPTDHSRSMAQTLVTWLGLEARRQNVTLMGENALAGGVMHASGWENIEKAIATGNYAGLTVLRLSQITDSEAGKRGIKRLLMPADER